MITIPPLNGNHTYSILNKKYDKIVGIFGSPELCHQYMKFLKEDCFFNTGSMETAEQTYGEDSYILQRSFTCTESYLNKIGVSPTEWAHSLI